MMDSKKVADKLQFATIKLNCWGENFKEQGTGFFFAFPHPDNEHMIIPVIVTNRHLLFDTKNLTQAHSLTGRISMLHDDAGEIEKGTDTPLFIPKSLPSLTLLHKHTDLAIIAIGEILNVWTGTASIKYLTPTDIPNNRDMRNINAMHDIIMVGYPQGWQDELHNFPLFRRGITATNPGIDFSGEGKNTFLIDATCIPGSSGSPVFSYELHTGIPTLLGPVFKPHIKLIGIQSEGYQYDAEGEAKIINDSTGQDIPLPSTTKVFANIGVAVNASCIMDFQVSLNVAIRDSQPIAALSPQYYEEYCKTHPDD